MRTQPEMLKKSWDTLILLDACRFDLFEELHSRWLRGKLIRVRSAGRGTVEWLKETWEDYYDLIYFSANPYINSKGAPIKNFCALNHFSEIIDVWELAWNDELGTVLPMEMNKIVIETEINKRAVIHYMQPHFPYIGRRRLFRAPGRFRKRILGQKEGKPAVKSSPEPNKRDAYIETLDLVIQRASELVPYLKGKIIISADHGELLGEDGKWGHGRRLDHPLLWEVPWFEVRV